MKLRRLVITLMPKGLIGMLLLTAAAISFALVIAPKLANPQASILLVAIVGGALGINQAVPLRTFERWDRWHRHLRATLVAIPAYVILVTVGKAEELYNFRLWGEFLIPTGFSPWTWTNTTAALAALSAAASQFYWPSRPILDSEQFIRGSRLISFGEAFRRAALLRAESAPAATPKANANPSLN